eukprot:CAMPEP_0170501898 /NCGR_PEP_ID=MMETSP0208-20121228/39795_1 /TAXON_ID=197538 /ORGANISM="Strombidium inclinatum, Strain S3" /LENGTH=81 /DNA_ID=CAMNT_0010780671 /DNA_START=1986 /DNA_END=2231 /DNA_ORIENTATION=+
MEKQFFTKAMEEMAAATLGSFGTSNPFVSTKEVEIQTSEIGNGLTENDEQQSEREEEPQVLKKAIEQARDSSLSLKQEQKQ